MSIYMVGYYNDPKNAGYYMDNSYECSDTEETTEADVKTTDD